MPKGPSRHQRREIVKSDEGLKSDSRLKSDSGLKSDGGLKSDEGQIQSTIFIVDEDCQSIVFVLR